MEYNNALEEILWTGTEYDKGLNGKKVLIFGYYDPQNVEGSQKKNPASDVIFKNFSERIKTFFNFDSSDDFINRITYVNLCNANRIKKSEITGLISFLRPDIVIYCGVNLRDNVLKPNKIIESSDLAEITIYIESSESLSNIEQQYIYREETKDRPYIVLNTFSLAYDFGDGNNIFDGNKLSLFMSICFDSNIYDKIIKNEPIKIKAKEIGYDKPFILRFCPKKV